MTTAVESSAVAARPVPSAPADTHSGSRWSRLWRNAAVFAWLLLVYAACFQQAISTMAALSAQQEILAKERSVAASANGDKAVSTNEESKNISAKAQLVKAIKLLQDVETKENIHKNPDGSKNDTNQPNENGGGKNDTNQVSKNSNDSAFDKLTPWVQSAAIEARAGFYNTDNLNYIIMPIALVTLMLCLWMGALGSAVHMTLEFLKKDETKTGLWFFFRPFYGALLALAVFIIFQAGQMVLTNPVEGNAGLNPYVIAFVAIVSGMLSDQAYHRIAFAGSQFLGKADATPRWVRTSVAQEKLATRTVADLLRHTPETPTATAEAWLSGSKELYAAEQTVLAAWLDVESRDLFTDQPPPKSGKPGPGAQIPAADANGGGDAANPPGPAPGNDAHTPSSAGPDAASEHSGDGDPGTPLADAPTPDKRAA